MQKSSNNDFLKLTELALKNHKTPIFEDLYSDFNKTIKRHFSDISNRISLLFLKYHFDEIQSTAKIYIDKNLKDNIFENTSVNTDLILPLWLANFGPTSKTSIDVFLCSIAKVC